MFRFRFVFSIFNFRFVFSVLKLFPSLLLLFLRQGLVQAVGGHHLLLADLGPLSNQVLLPPELGQEDKAVTQNTSAAKQDWLRLC